MSLAKQSVYLLVDLCSMQQRRLTGFAAQLVSPLRRLHPLKVQLVFWRLGKEWENQPWLGFYKHLQELFWGTTT